MCHFTTWLRDKGVTYIVHFTTFKRDKGLTYMYSVISQLGKEIKASVHAVTLHKLLRFKGLHIV